ncbi:unnamed protein product [Pedinophyceae sp. YPF-701]|nr:unnamed protein product [Pedinophyceae sp. YPF-701]
MAHPGLSSPGGTSFDAESAQEAVKTTFQKLADGLDVLKILDDTAANWTAVQRLISSHKTLVDQIIVAIGHTAEEAGRRGREADMSRRDNEQLRAEVAELSESNAALTAELRNVRGAQGAAEARCEQLERDRVAADARAEAATREAALAQDSLHQARSRVAELERDVAVAAERASAMTQRIRTVEEEARRLRAAEAEASQRLRGTEAELNAKLDAARIDGERKGAEVADLRAEQTRLKMQVEGLQREATGMQGEMEAVKAALTEANARRERAQEQAAGLERDVSDLRIELREQERQNEGLLDQAQRLRTDVHLRQAELRSAKQSLREGAARQADLEARMRERERHAGALIGEISVLKVKLAKMDAAKQIGRERAEMRASEAERARADMERALQVERAKAATLAKELTRLEAAVAAGPVAQEQMAEEIHALRRALAEQAAAAQKRHDAAKASVERPAPLPKASSLKALASHDRGGAVATLRAKAPSQPAGAPAWDHGPAIDVMRKRLAALDAAAGAQGQEGGAGAKPAVRGARGPAEAAVRRGRGDGADGRGDAREVAGGARRSITESIPEEEEVAGAGGEEMGRIEVSHARALHVVHSDPNRHIRWAPGVTGGSLSSMESPRAQQRGLRGDPFNLNVAAR